MDKLFRVTRTDGYVHFYHGSEGKDGLVFPQGGGMGVHLNMSTVKSIEEVEHIDQEYKHGVASLNCGLHVRCVFNPYSRWNGWYRPLIAEHDMEHFINGVNMDFKTHLEEYGMGDHWEIRNGKVFAVHREQCDDEVITEEYEEEPITINGVKYYDVSNGYVWICQERRELLEDRVSCISSASDFIGGMIALILGAGFHGDTRAEDYIDGDGNQVFTDEEVELFNARLDEAHKVCDVNEVAIRCLKEQGLWEGGES